MTFVFQSRFKTVFSNFGAITKRFEKLDQDEARRAQEHRQEMSVIMENHRSDMEGMRNQIIQMIKGG
ncbi:hypothetical protein LCGC14_0451330 [marine sediment metagenome]|uniref:Uncharacterized protein n=1 Tax=marine sediment metagenome TaxID=412755 RepID=A0A0F9T128_9ZZZZ